MSSTKFIALSASLFICFFLFNSCKEKRVIGEENETNESNNRNNTPNLSIHASSSMKASFGFDYSAQNIIDGNLETWWSPRTSNNFKNQVTIDFNLSAKISGFQILAGSHYLDHPKFGNIYFKNHRIKKIKVEVYQGELFLDEFVFRLKDIDELQTVNFPRNLKCSSLIITPLEIYNTSKWPDICISEIIPNYAGN
ncbi:MAG: discoidin domain-containing protein [Bacteroidota bacterium]|jgi:hypothetical protein